MLTIQILTRNNEDTIRACIESTLRLNAEIVVGDLGSTDNTISICDEMGAITHHLGGMERHEARNSLTKDGLNLALEPWEVWSQGLIPNADCAYVSILNNQIITKEIRFWQKPMSFINPTFERVDAETINHSNVVLYSIGSRDYDYDKLMLAQWKKNPVLAAPYYYQACVELALKNYPEFFRSAEYYLFRDKSNSMSAIMLRYYMAYAHMFVNKKVRPALQNLNLCLCAKPMMSEFWCLMADIYYHLLKDWRKATDFYENAIILGSRRKAPDTWPLDLSKYNKYPTKMIESCQKLLDRPSIYHA